jgi:hypothetical protein
MQVTIVPASSFHYLCRGGRPMDLANIAIEPIFSILIGILILVVPRFLNYFVAVYLIIIGILGLMN